MLLSHCITLFEGKGAVDYLCSKSYTDMGVLICKICACFYLSNCSCHQDLDMRFGFDLCSEEMAFLGKRKRYVASALKNVFHLQQDLQDHEVRVCGGVAYVEFLVPSRTLLGKWSSKWDTCICCACTSLSVYLKHICFCCQGLLLQERQVAIIASFMTVNLEFVRFEVHSSLPSYAINGLVQKHCVQTKYIT